MVTLRINTFFYIKLRYIGTDSHHYSIKFVKKGKTMKNCTIQTIFNACTRLLNKVYALKSHKYI